MKNLKLLPIILIIVVLAVLAVLVGGCAGEEKPPDQVTVQLKWIHQAQFAGIYTADQKGFYDEENIDVTLNAGGPDIPIEKMIADLVSGEATFAIVGADQVLTAIALGADDYARKPFRPLELVARIKAKLRYIGTTG